MSSSGNRQWYDAFYRQHSFHDMGPWYQGSKELLEDLAPIAPRTIVEVGCGHGAFLATLKESDFAIGLDSSSEASRMTKKRGVIAVVAQGERLPLASGAADVVVCCEVLEHVNSPEIVVAEIARVLRDNGLAIVSSPNYLSPGWLLLRLLSDLFKRPEWVVRQPVDRLLTYFAVRRFLRRQGFTIAKSVGFVLEPPGLYHVRNRRGKPPLRSQALSILALHPVFGALKGSGTPSRRTHGG